MALKQWSEERPAGKSVSDDFAASDSGPPPHRMAFPDTTNQAELPWNPGRTRTRLERRALLESWR